MNFADQLGRTIILKEIPVRIVSLVPSQTELLYDLGLREEVVGITKFCIHPKEWHQTKTIIGGTKKIDFEKITTLKPDLVIGNKEEDLKEDIDKTSESFPVWVSDIKHIEAALNMIQCLGEITGRIGNAEEIIQKIKSAFDAFESLKNKKRVLYLIWRKPWMSVNADTFIHEMLVKCGFENVAKANPNRYPVLLDNELQDLRPEVIFLSSEPYPFKEKHFHELRRILPDTAFLLVDGEAFSWYGSHLIKSAVYFKELVRLFST
jgi:ABC-type Fe3+-hydroxamate transport system substrate-binding protein